MFTLIRLIFLPAKLGLGSAKLGVKTGYRTGRLVGYRRIFLFGLGIGVGLLIAPMTGREARAKLQELLEARRGGGGVPSDLAERVRFELSHSPRTWHLPQPEVEVLGSTAILRGAVPHETGRAELERTAAAVAGIVAVENLLDIASNAGTNGQG